MSVTLVFGCLVLTMLAILFNRRAMAWFWSSLALVMMIAIGGGGVAKFLGPRVQTFPRLVNVDWKPRNVIVVLGLGTLKWPDSDVVTTHTMGYSRVFEAARLYTECRKDPARECKILASGGDPSRNGVSEAEVMGLELREIGVAESDLLLETKSSNTFRNAQLSSEMLKATPFENMILVTSGFHLRRAMLYFSHFSGPWIGAPSDRAPFRVSGLPLTGNFMIFDGLMHELMGIWRYQFYNLMGWNPPRAADSK